MNNLRNNCCYSTNLCLSRNNDEIYHTTCFRSIFCYLRLKALYCSVQSLSFMKAQESAWVRVIKQKYKWNIPKVCQGMNVLCPGNKMSILIAALYLLVACYWINTGEWVKIVVHPMWCHSSTCLFSYVYLDRYQVNIWEKYFYLFICYKFYYKYMLNLFIYLLYAHTNIHANLERIWNVGTFYCRVI